MTFAGDRQGQVDGPVGVSVPNIQPTLCDLGLFMDESSESISSDALDVGVDRIG